MGLNLIKAPNNYAASRENDLGISVYFKNDVVSTIKIPKETDLKSFLVLNQQVNDNSFLKEIEDKSIHTLTDSIYTSIDNLSEFDSHDSCGSIEKYDEIVNMDEDFDNFLCLSHRQRLNSNENYVIIVQKLDEKLSLNSSAKNVTNPSHKTNEIILNTDILLNVMSIKNECTKILNKFL
jgi:hypothetical protein